MKTKIALSLIMAALLPACTTTRTTSTTRYSDDKNISYANNAVGDPAPPAEGPEADIPTEGPADVNPAYVPSPLLRSSAATGP